MKMLLLSVLVLLAVNTFASAQDAMFAVDLNKKIFPINENVTCEKVSFYTRLGIQIAADLYMPKEIDKSKKYPGIIVGHPFGGSKEQTSGLYAQELANSGFVTLAFDMERYGESGGQPRNVASPEGFVEDFMAAMDFMGMRPFVDRERIGIMGICASGSLAVAAASIDPRFKAVATVSMNDLGRSRREGANGEITRERLKGILADAAQQRWKDLEEGTITYGPGAPESVDENSNIVARDFFDYYRTPRGQHPRATTNTSLTSISSLMLFYPFELIDTISPRPMLFIAGDKAYTLRSSEDAYNRAGEPKELHIVQGATHVDLYDGMHLIPYSKLESFFKENLKE